MEKQMSFAQAEYAGKKRITRKEKFLGEMEKIVPWARLVEGIEPHYPRGERGRPPVGIERMLRIYFLQQWYALSDEGLEDAIYDSQAMRTFAGIDLSVEGVPDATTLLNFRHLLEKHGLTKAIFQEVGAMLEEKKLLMREGTIVDATIIAAPPSIKNERKERDPEMHQTRKGNQWYFGMKAHVGADAHSGLIHTVIGTAANVADVKCASALPHGKEKVGYGDAGYTGVEKRQEQSGQAGSITWEVAMKRGKLKAMAEGECKELTRRLERLKAQVRSKVEHGFHVIKNLFGYRKGALPGAGQEYGATPHPLCLGQSRARQEQTAGRDSCIASSKSGKTGLKATENPSHNDRQGSICRDRGHETRVSAPEIAKILPLISAQQCGPLCSAVP